MSQLTFEADVECLACKGTGLYQGMCERDGTAVVCHMCDGTGKQHVRHDYTEFTKRKIKKGVTRVFKSAGGYVITSKDIMTSNGKKIIEFSKAGATYEEWLAGATLKPICDLQCPISYFEQGTEIGEWLKKSKDFCLDRWKWGSSYTSCAETDNNRADCWERFKKSKYAKEIE